MTMSLSNYKKLSMPTNDKNTINNNNKLKKKKKNNKKHNNTRATTTILAPRQQKRLNVDSRSILLSFPKKYTKKVQNTYLPHVVNRSKATQEEKVVRSYLLGRFFTWRSIHLE